MIDTFSPAWMAGYVIGRRPHRPSELPPARERSVEVGGADSFDDGYDTGRAAAGRLPHRALVDVSIPERVSLGERELEFDSRCIEHAEAVGLYTGDPVLLECTDGDNMLQWSAQARIVSSDLNSSRVTVYLEQVFE